MPRGCLKFAWPTTGPVRAPHAAGAPVGRATDGAASENFLDVGEAMSRLDEWEAMALTSLIQKSTGTTHTG
ncbi:hypothetical protein SHL15_1999 [Streptomyces hygroscopicus subsp. limoneus]|nr:hypothetical protein SHL15_1999 [Streptomyces hygroscopicus subsp. limoneus]